MNLAESIASDRAKGLLQDQESFDKFCKEDLSHQFARAPQIEVSWNYFKGIVPRWDTTVIIDNLTRLGFNASSGCGRGRMDETYIRIALPDPKAFAGYRD